MAISGIVDTLSMVSDKAFTTFNTIGTSVDKKFRGELAIQNRFARLFPADMTEKADNNQSESDQDFDSGSILFEPGTDENETTLRTKIIDVEQSEDKKMITVRYEVIDQYGVRATSDLTNCESVKYNYSLGYWPSAHNGGTG